MQPRSLSTIAQVLAGELHGSGQGEIHSVSTDSRRIKAGELFFALRGEHFDGHAFIARAAEAGAAGAVVDRLQPALSRFPQLLVSDALRALQKLAAWSRQELTTHFIGITGSNGKTSAKEMVAAVLGEQYRVLKTEGNLNNHIGVPLSLLRADEQHDYAVIELGMNHTGEIAALTALVRPEIGMITNIGLAHIEFLGSKQAIAAEKAVLAEQIPQNGTLILNANDDFTPWIAEKTRARVLQAGLGKGDLQANNLVHLPAGEHFSLRGPGFETHVELPVVGQHMVENAVLAAALAYSIGMSPQSIAAGLRQTKIPGGRLKLQQLGRLILINDSYNANPDSMIAALRTAKNLPVSGRRIAVLGRMGELGEQSIWGHQRVGQAAAELGFKLLVTVGEEAEVIATAAANRGLKNTVPAADHASAISALSELLEAGDVVLVKGSFSAQMDRVVEGLEAAGKGARWSAP
jgi:UDP-N-acetylmuramoyl-tripeptide--D-alanyl-D-alanine ligase